MNANNPKKLPAIVKKINDTISKYGLIQENDKVLASVSGGPDSIFLVHALNLLKDIFKFRLLCFHLDHLTRNGQSTADAAFVKQFCTDNGIELISYTVDAKRWSKDNRLSFQEGARALRIRLLEETADKKGATKIAVGHTASDNIETFFLNLLRGSGLNGLSGIAPANGRFIRPLIDIERNEIEKYLKDKSIQYMVDTSNLENIYSRNKIRNLLLPFIREDFAADIDKKISLVIRNLRDDNRLIEEIALQGLNEVTGKTAGKDSAINKSLIVNSSLTIDLLKLSVYPVPLVRRILMCAIEKVKGSATDIKSKNIDAVTVVALQKGGPAKEVTLPDGVLVIKENEKLFLFKYTGATYNTGTTYKEASRWAPQALKDLEAAEDVNEINPGSIQVYEEKGIKIKTEIISGGIGLIKDRKLERDEAYLDYDCISFPVIMRFWEEKGEKFQPLGLRGSKKLQDFFIDRKVPPSLRSRIPLFFDNAKLIWVAGYEIDERVKLTDKTVKIFHIKIFKN
jgi:tRNA(Ile)-lysidine synthase